MRTVRSTCAYCGVGCGVLASVADDGQITVRGDPEHPANLGRLCSKGAALDQTLGQDGRLLHPEIDGRRASWDEALDAVAQGFARIIAEHGPEAVAFYVSGQLLTEDYYVANKLMKGYIGAANIDTNSRLCMSSSVAGHVRAFGEDLVPCSYEDLERAKLIVLTGSNTAWCHPVLFQRMRQAKQDNPDLQIVVIDPRRTATCEIADLHLALRPGSDVMLFNGLLAHLARSGEHNEAFTARCSAGLEAALSSAAQDAPDIATVARYCALDEADVSTFYRLFARTERVVTVYSQGVNQSSAGTDKVNAIINCHLLTGRIGRPGMGPFSFTGQPNAMGGREVGGLANQLAAHLSLDDPAHRESVQRFWYSPRIAQRLGFKAVDLFKAVGQGRVKAIWIMGTNPAVSLPDADRVRSALEQCELVVVSDCVRETDTTACADILLPALAWGEKDGTVTNSERRISRQRAFLPAPGEARPDWWMVCEVARRMGFSEGFGYTAPAEIFREHAALSAHENEGGRLFNIGGLAALDEAEYDGLNPVQWPLPNRDAAPAVRLFGDGRFATPDGRARFVAVRTRAPVNAADVEYPLVLNTGRVRDQWHTMTRTGTVPRLSEHSPEPTVAIHPEDAARFGVADGGLARLTSRWGRAILRVAVSTDQPRGSVFVPMHWSGPFAASARVDALVNPEVDPVSGQPELKHTPAHIERVATRWRGLLLSRRRLLDIPRADYWARTAGTGFHRYVIEGGDMADWSRWARELLCETAEAVNWVEYLDRSAGRYRAVRLVGERLESCLFVAPTAAQLPAQSWLETLFLQEAITEAERASLLTGRGVCSDRELGPVVCACFGVRRQAIVDAVRREGLRTAQAVGERLRAGTNCGSCIPEINAIVATQAQS